VLVETKEQVKRHGAKVEAFGVPHTAAAHFIAKGADRQATARSSVIFAFGVLHFDLLWRR